MFGLPPIPSWDGLHPLIIHFPIGLLFVAPIFVLIGAVLGAQRGRSMLYSALVLMALGTASIYLAVETGEAAGKMAERTPEINAALEHHENLAENTRMVFSVLTGLFVIVVALPLLRRRNPGRITATVLPLGFLVLYLGAMLLLANTADHGGRLVHQLGVHALVAPGSTPAAQAPDTHGE